MVQRAPAHEGQRCDLDLTLLEGLAHALQPQDLRPDRAQALLALAAASFAYGAFHAAGPGHGKAVISSYVVANREIMIETLPVRYRHEDLARAGLTDVHLLPVFDIATVPETNCVNVATGGAPASAFGENTITKFSARLSHFTSRSIS